MLCSADTCEYTIRPTERVLHVCLIHMLTYSLRSVRQENFLLCCHTGSEFPSFCPVLLGPAAITLSSCLTQALIDLLFVLRPAPSQNHKLVEVGRGLSRSPGSTPLLKQGHQKPVPQDHVQVAFEYLQGWRLHHLTRQPMPVLSHPQYKKVFPDLQAELDVF